MVFLLTYLLTNLFTYWLVDIGHVGGLLALFLGASFITCLELLHIIAHRYFCACVRHRPNQHRKRCRRKSNPGDANHAPFRSLDDVTSDALPVSNHNDARRGVLKTPSPLQTSNVAPCSGRLTSMTATNTQRSSTLNSRSILRPSPLAETDI